jgi:hypothetical protein
MSAIPAGQLREEEGGGARTRRLACPLLPNANEEIWPNTAQARHPVPGDICAQPNCLFDKCAKWNSGTRAKPMGPLPKTPHRSPVGPPDRPLPGSPWSLPVPVESSRISQYGCKNSLNNSPSSDKLIKLPVRQIRQTNSTGAAGVHGPLSGSGWPAFSASAALPAPGGR